MTWHTATVPAEALARLLASIRDEGGTVTSARPGDGIEVTWTTDGCDAARRPSRPTARTR